MKVRVGHHRKQTRFLPCTLEPNWDETVALRGRLRDFCDQELLLKVRDHDVGAIRDDRLGEFRIMRLELDELRAARGGRSSSTTPSSTARAPATATSRSSSSGSRATTRPYVYFYARYD